MKKILLLIMISGAVTFLFRCSTAPMAGGGTESTNGRILGMLLEEDGSPATQTRVMLLSSNYDPVKNGPVRDSMIDTTDEGGRFDFQAASGVTFNIEAFQPSSGKRTLINGIMVNKNDTEYIPIYEVQKPGAIKFIMSSLSDIGYVYIPGTTRFAMVQEGNAMIDSVPPGFIPSIVYAGINGPIRDSVAAVDLMVHEGSTMVIANSSVWKYSKRAYLNTTASGAGVSTTVTNFPVLIRLTSGNFDFSKARSDGGDIRFVNEKGTPFPYEIERWDAGAGLADVWVKVDTVYGNDSVHSFLMCWGDSTVVSASNGAAVFDTGAGFAGVWHLGRPAGAIIPDATANGNNGATTATTTVSGAIGTAQSFDGVSSLVRTSGPAEDKLNFSDSGTYSVSAWVKTNVLDTLCQAIVFKSNAQYGMQIIPEHDWEFATYIDKTRWEGSRSAASAGSWHSIVGVRNGTRQYLYVDGVRTDSLLTNTIALAPENVARVYDKPLEIGHCPDGGRNPDRFFNGIIDEVRISRTPLNADWIKLCYMNQKEQDALVMFK